MNIEEINKVIDRQIAICHELSEGTSERHSVSELSNAIINLILLKKEINNLTVP